ncbi:MAG: serpin family protein [Candidatus Aminicenantes bacterium]|nr:serpin family protein [Candidatus Aminicenantes bacterium]NIM77391.1 serpin family protein [Candidatus Aminicenantes bacterium]NIN16688.1 serpin family protein [Candidatus Aminicenantes bacterium]NIN40544.1 serpin family protein [Candidatus Aminicenantes bacterium]NIN83364.1 serpin family protein [Candidatus Aminicenantes bacterium]
MPSTTAILLILLVSLTVLPLSAGNTTTETLVKGNTTFAVELYRKLERMEGNIFFSPYSISTALAMTYGGARGNTAKQMADVLHFIPDNNVLHPGFAGLEAQMNDVRQRGYVELNVANSLWPQENYPFLPEYLDLIKEYYKVSITPVDYKGAAEKARNTINKWVEEKTKKKITNLIQPGILTELTRLVLVNAIYFKGNWASRFDVNRTEETDFYLLNGKIVRTPMMNQVQIFKYGEYGKLQILELPYDGNDLSMIVFLPNKPNGLAKLDNYLTVERLETWLSVLRKRKVKVFLPKFKMTSYFRLDKTLAGMGMPDAFNAAADFSGMDGTRELFIQAVLHKAFVGVDEEGTEAAAATAGLLGKKGPPPRPTVFRADHPFFFLIRENKTGSILFMGKLLNPAQK